MYLHGSFIIIILHIDFSLNQVDYVCPHLLKPVESAAFDNIIVESLKPNTVHHYIY